MSIPTSRKQLELFETHRTQDWTGVREADIGQFTDEWVYIRDNKAYHTVHRFHPFFAMCPPPIARRAIERYSIPGDLVFDPFCGAGVTMVEAMLAGRDSLGIDILAIATLISKVKTTPIEFSMAEVAPLVAQVTRTYAEMSDRNIELPAIYNVDYWFPSETQKQLAAIHKVAIGEADKDRRDFLRVCLSSIVRMVSRSSNLETHLHLKKGKPVRHAVKLFEARLYDMVTRMRHFRDQLPPKVSTKVLNMDNREMLSAMNPDSVDYIFTSPPYGTGTKYASVYRLQQEILELPRPKRPHEASRDFLEELGKTFNLMLQVLKPEARCSILYGSNKHLSTADVVDLAKKQGFIYEEAILCPVIDESKMVRGDYRRHMPNELLLTLRKPARPKG